MIIAATPYCPRDIGKGRDYGYALNSFMELLRPEDWAVLIDHDCIWTYRYWFRRIEKAVELHPDAGFFTVMRYPANTLWAVPSELQGSSNEDLRFHRQIGAEIASRYEGEIVDVTNYENLDGGTPNAGIFILKKSVWSETGGFRSGWARIDHKMHKMIRQLGYKAYLLKDLYIYHPKGMWFE